MLALPPAARTTREAGSSPLPSSPASSSSAGDAAVRPVAEAESPSRAAPPAGRARSASARAWQLLDPRHVAPALERVAAERRVGGHPERARRRPRPRRRARRAPGRGRARDRPSPIGQAAEARARAGRGSRSDRRARSARPRGSSCRRAGGATAVCGSKWLSGRRFSATREVVGGGLGALAAALEHQHPEAPVGERQRGDDADRARADDADVRGEVPERREAAALATITGRRLDGRQRGSGTAAPGSNTGGSA